MSGAARSFILVTDEKIISSRDQENLKMAFPKTTLEV